MSSWHALRRAVYDLESEDETWVEAVHAECRELFDEGLGTFVYAYRFCHRPAIRLTHVAGCETAPDFWRTLEAWGAANAAVLARSYGTGPGSLRQAERAAKRAGAALSNAEAAFEPHRVSDVLTVLGHDQSGFGICVTAPRARTVVEPSGAERRSFERLAIELAVATRLREHRRQRRDARLTAAESQVVRLLIEGAPDKHIAAELGVTLSTVSTFMARVRRKLGCRPGQELLLLQRAPGPSLHRRMELFARLTSAECDVASELLVGATHGEIAERRGVSVQTIASQCAGIFRKCGVSGRRELAAAML
jgi:DNA-binding NarL/FixJ family response regulator